MSTGRAFTRLLASCGEPFAPPARWQDRVFARIERDEARARPRGRGWNAWLGLVGAEMALVAALALCSVSYQDQTNRARLDLYGLRAREELLVRALYVDDPEARWGWEGCVCPPLAPPSTSCAEDGC